MYLRTRSHSSYKLFFIPMQMKSCLVVAMLSGLPLWAQNQNPPAPAPRELETPAYVRRFSVGATLSVLGLPMVRGRTDNIVTTTPVVDSLYTTTGATRRVGFGLTAQVALTNRFAVNAGVFRRSLGYKMNSDILQGTDNPNTTVDERTHIVQNEDTRAKLFDFPVTVRYYGKDRREPGARWFIEAGGVLRRVSQIRTSIDTTVNSGDTQCCDVTPANPGYRSVHGFVGGAGVQLIDPLGIRVVPEVRYTRWVDVMFANFSTGTNRNQLEAMISLTF